jgi:zinc protease
MRRRSPLIFSYLLGCAALCVAAGADAVPKIQSWSTENGATVLFIEAHSLPIVDVRVVFSAGSARDADKPGLALLTNSLLMSGAGDLNADDIAARLEDVGANAGTESQRDMAVVSMRSLSDPDKLEVMRDVMRAVITQPTFPETDLERDRKRLLLAIRHKQEQPEEVATDIFYQAIYDRHPYALPSEGEAKSVRSLLREDLLKFYQQYYVGNNTVVALVGDLDKAGARELAEALVGALPAGEAPEPIPPVTPLPAAVEKQIPMSTVQTHILLGQPGIRRNDPDYFSLYVGNHILGGSGFESRLMRDIREDRGLAYSVYSYFLPMASEGPFIAGMQTRNEQAVDALRLMRDNIGRFVEQGPTDAELSSAVRNITGGFPLRIDSNSKLVEYLAMIAFYKLPLDHLAKFNDHIRQVTTGSIQDAFVRRVHPDRMVTVTVGNSVPTAP